MAIYAHQMHGALKYGAICPPNGGKSGGMENRMPKKTTLFWRARVFEAYERDARKDRTPASVIAREIEAIACDARTPEAERGAFPAERTIRESLREEYRQLEAYERTNYRPVAWPETFREESLPWESAAMVLELLRHNQTKGLPRPTVAAARWYWQVTLSAPALGMAERLHLTGALAAAEAGLGPDGAETHRLAEAVLLGQPGALSARAGPVPSGRKVMGA